MLNSIRFLRTYGGYSYTKTIYVNSPSYSSYTGVILMQACLLLWLEPAPRTYGGYSNGGYFKNRNLKFSPYTRRLFGRKSIITSSEMLLPVPTGVILTLGKTIEVTKSTPRTHGGYSVPLPARYHDVLYSPYTRGLFVMDVLNAEFNPFSPYTRRLFYRACIFRPHIIVFSVLTEVFL